LQQVPKTTKPELKYDDVEAVSCTIASKIIAQLKANGVLSASSEVEGKDFSSAILQDLNTLKNTAYTRGFMARMN
jgi:transcriptional regulator NrdR family protein